MMSLPVYMGSASFLSPWSEKGLQELQETPGKHPLVTQAAGGAGFRFGRGAKMPRYASAASGVRV